MSHLLDTNVISELRNLERRADVGVRAWVAARAPSDLYLSAITVLEVEVGIGRLARRDPAQAGRLQTWFDEELIDAFSGHILPVDVPVARRAARLQVPDSRPERDVLIAATAAVHGFAVVTCNVNDFEPLDVAVINPWGDKVRFLSMAPVMQRVASGLPYVWECGGKNTCQPHCRRNPRSRPRTSWHLLRCETGWQR